MKKFSWIFALILALSIGFIGCPAGDDDDTPPPPPSGPTKVIKFGTDTTAGQVKIFKNGENNDGAYDPGTLEYLADGSGYRYTYTPASNYGNSILRFKVDLGETVTLGEYGAVTFDWEAEGFIDDSDPVASNKKPLLLASANEADLKPYKSDALSGSGSLIPFIISTDYFDNSPHSGVPSSENPDKLWASALQPTLNGIEKVTVTLPIVKSDYLLGEVWFAIYVHAGSGSYTISNFKLGGDPNAGTVYGPNPPSRPIVPGTPNAWFYLDLSDYYVGYDYNGTTPVTPTYPDAPTRGGKLSAVFGTDGNERLNIALTTDQTDALKNATGTHINVRIKGRVVSGDGNGFRYHIGDASTGNSWAKWGAVAGTFDAILTGLDLAYPNQGADPKHFILQHNTVGTAGVELEILSIRIEFESATAGEATTISDVRDRGIVPITFSGSDVSAIGEPGDAISNETSTGYTLTTTRVDWDADESVGASYFKVTLPTGYKLGNFTNLAITVKGNSGDIGYKRVFLNLVDKDSTPTAADILNWSDDRTGCSARVTQNNDSGATAVERFMDFTSTANTGESFDDFVDADEVWFVIYTWATAAEWEFSDIYLY